MMILKKSFNLCSHTCYNKYILWIKSIKTMCHWECVQVFSLAKCYRRWFYCLTQLQPDTRNKLMLRYNSTSTQTHNTHWPCTLLIWSVETKAGPFCSLHPLKALSKITRIQFSLTILHMNSNHQLCPFGCWQVLHFQLSVSTALFVFATNMVKLDIIHGQLD